jgi:hypothetical protein
VRTAPQTNGYCPATRHRGDFRSIRPLQSLGNQLSYAFALEQREVAVDQSNHVATRKAPWNRSALLKVELPFSEPKLSIDGFCTARCFTAAAAVSEATRHETRADCYRAPQPHSRCRNSNQLETWHSSRGQPSQVEPEERMDNYTPRNRASMRLHRSSDQQAQPTHGRRSPYPVPVPPPLTKVPPIGGRRLRRPCRDH